MIVAWKCESTGFKKRKKEKNYSGDSNLDIAHANLLTFSWNYKTQVVAPTSYIQT